MVKVQLSSDWEITVKDQVRPERYPVLVTLRMDALAAWRKTAMLKCRERKAYR